MLKLPHKITT